MQDVRYKKDGGMGLLLHSLCITYLACILLSLHLVAVVFGMAIPTYLYIVGKRFHLLHDLCVNYNTEPATYKLNAGFNLVGNGEQTCQENGDCREDL